MKRTFFKIHESVFRTRHSREKFAHGRNKSSENLGRYISLIIDIYINHSYTQIEIAITREIVIFVLRCGVFLRDRRNIFVSQFPVYIALSRDAIASLNTNNDKLDVTRFIIYYFIHYYFSLYFEFIIYKCLSIKISQTNAIILNIKTILSATNPNNIDKFHRKILKYI